MNSTAYTGIGNQTTSIGTADPASIDGILTEMEGEVSRALGNAASVADRLHGSQARENSGSPRQSSVVGRLGDLLREARALNNELDQASRAIG